MEKYYCIAGINICIKGDDAVMYTNERILEKFRTSPQENAIKFQYEIRESLDCPEGDFFYHDQMQRIYRKTDGWIRYMGDVGRTTENAYLRSETKEAGYSVQVLSSVIKDRISVKLVLNSLGLENLVLKEQGMILHASYIKVGDRAILFTAPSGTGKSTQADLWKKYRGAEIINGDRAIIRYSEDDFWACGLPFSGSSVYCENEEVRLQAIVYLGQAKTNSIKQIGGKNAFMKIWEGINLLQWNREAVSNAMVLTQKLIGTVPVYQLDCVPDESAIKILEEQLNVLEERR